MDTSNMTLMEIFSNPDVMHTLTFGQKMLASTITMIMGLGITFTVLILIWIFISIMGKALGTGTQTGYSIYPLIPIRLKLSKQTSKVHL